MQFQEIIVLLSYIRIPVSSMSYTGGIPHLRKWILRKWDTAVLKAEKLLDLT